MLVDENKKLKIQSEYKDTILEFIQSLKNAAPQPKIVDIAKSNRPQMSFTIVNRSNRTHAK
jgi:hypothetical protein